MKKLHLIRHAKSSWAEGGLADIDRPLNRRGLAACPVMAEQIVKAGCEFEQVFCSPATRAQSTIEQISQHLAERDIRWQTEEALYTFDVGALLRWCQELDDAISQPVVVGHNPAMTGLCNLIGDHPIENLPTCGYVQLAISVSSWRELSTGSGELLSFLKPKMFVNKEKLL